MTIRLNELKELARIVDKNKVKNIQIIGTPQLPKTKFDLFYEGLILEQFENELSASNYFYNKSPNHSAYKKLKDRLSERMLNTLFFIDVNNKKFDAIQTAYYTCYKNIAAIKILLGRNARLSAITLAEKTLQKAIHFEFTDIVLALAKELRMHYGSIVGNKKNFILYNKMVSKYFKIYQAELTAEEYYNQLTLNFVNSSETKLEFLNLAADFSLKLRGIIKKHSSYRLNLSSFIVFSLRYEIVNDYEGTIKICNEALDYFNTKKHISSKIAKFTFLLKLLSCYTNLCKFKKGEVTALQCLELLPEGSNNWFITLNYYIILLFHSTQFEKAFSIYQKAISNSNFQNQYKNISEHWKIHEAFIHYFILKGKIIIEEEKRLKKFRITKFLNEVPTYSKDKRGANISILILQILFLLEQKKYQKIRDRVEALQVYTYRYLRKDHTYRSNCFIKMLLQLPKSKFNKTAVERKVEKYKEKLQKATNNIANQSSLIEIVPYETLWEYVLDSLDNKFH